MYSIKLEMSPSLNHIMLYFYTNKMENSGILRDRDQS